MNMPVSYKDNVCINSVPHKSTAQSSADCSNAGAVEQILVGVSGASGTWCAGGVTSCM